MQKTIVISVTQTLSILLCIIGALLWGHIILFDSVNTPTLGKEAHNILHFTIDKDHPRVSGLQVPIFPGKKYAWSTYAIASEGEGEFGFYIDEYDANGVWVSGQWKGAITATQEGILTYEYVPSNDHVQFAAPQYYVTPNTSFEVLVDSPSIRER